MYQENDQYQHRNIEIMALFVTLGMQQWGTSRHLCICMYIVSDLVFILESSIDENTENGSLLKILSLLLGGFV